MWVGHCITAWAGLEDRLFEILWCILGCPQERAAIVYYKTPQLEARLTLTDELVRSILPKTGSGTQPHPDLKAWDAVRKSISEELAVRRRIAHQPVRTGKVIIPLSGDEKSLMMSGHLEFSYYEIYVSENEALRGKMAKPDTLNIHDLMEHEQTVKGLALQLHAFNTDVLATHAPKPVSPNPHKIQD
jgi:hypothetical protein